MNINQELAIFQPIRFNKIDLEDDYIQVGQKDSFKFYDGEDSKTVPLMGKSETLVSVAIFLSDRSTTYERKIYAVFDLMGDIGGLIEISMLCLGSLLASISEHSFFIKAIQKLFLVNTYDRKLFAEPSKFRKGGQKLNKERKSIQKHFNKEDQNYLNNHQVIKLSKKQSCKLYFMSLLGCCFCGRKKNRLWRLYTEGQDRIEKEFDLVKIIKSIRNIKVIMKHKLMNEKLKLEVKHSEKSVIDVESTPSDSTSSSDENRDKAGSEQMKTTDRTSLSKPNSLSALSKAGNSANKAELSG